MTLELGPAFTACLFVLVLLFFAVALYLQLVIMRWFDK